MRIGIIATVGEWNGSAYPHSSVAAGLRHLGYDLCVVDAGDWPVFSQRPDVVLVWNGCKGRRGRLARRLHDEGVAVLVMERGFFRREEYTQIDVCGFNHRASWARKLSEPAPVDGAERLERVVGKTTPVRSRCDGAVVVLLQVPGDSQLADSEVQQPDELVDAVVSAVDGRAEVVVRAHPMYDWTPRPGSGVSCLEGTLKQAVDKARFVVTINSNSANEALAWGKPVLCLGPALYGAAGVARTTSCEELPGAIDDMLDGWAPPVERVENYLRHLACRQWSRSELARGEGLKDILADAAGAKGVMG